MYHGTPCTMAHWLKVNASDSCPWKRATETGRVFQWFSTLCSRLQWTPMVHTCGSFVAHQCAAIPWFKIVPIAQNHCHWLKRSGSIIRHSAFKFVMNDQQSSQSKHFREQKSVFYSILRGRLHSCKYYSGYHPKFICLVVCCCCFC